MPFKVNTNFYLSGFVVFSIVEVVVVFYTQAHIYFPHAYDFQINLEYFLFE